MRERSKGRGWLGAAILCAALVLTAAAHSAMDTTSPVGTEKMFVPPAAQARLSSLGFHAVVADYYWLMAVQFIGGRFIVSDEDSLRAGELIDLVTTLDPWVGHPYRFAAMWLTESAEAVVASNRLLRRAIAYHPNDWRNRHYLGFNYFYYLGENLKAARIIEAAIQLPGAPRYLAGLVGKLRTDEDVLETTAEFLHQLVGVTEDEYAKASYLQAVDEVDTERRARLLDEARDVYRKQHGRDITSVRDLVEGPRPVLRVLPPPHPFQEGLEWIIDPETGQIVSSFYGARYAPYLQEHRRERRERWRVEARAWES